MEQKNAALCNEAQTMQELVNSTINLCSRLTPDQSSVNDATVRSLYTLAEAFRAELNNFSRLLDDYGK